MEERVHSPETRGRPPSPAGPLAGTLPQADRFPEPAHKGSLAPLSRPRRATLPPAKGSTRSTRGRHHPLSGVNPSPPHPPRPKKDDQLSFLLLSWQFFCKSMPRKAGPPPPTALLCNRLPCTLCCSLKLQTFYKNSDFFKNPGSAGFKYLSTQTVHKNNACLRAAFINEAYYSMNI